MSPWAKSLTKRKLLAFKRGWLAQLFIAYEVTHPDKAKQLRENLWNLLDFLQDAGVIEDDHYEYVIDCIHGMERQGRTETVIVLEVSAAKMHRALVAEELREKFKQARKDPRFAAGIIYYPAAELINVLETPLD